MIEIIGRNGPPEAMLCPAFICDACREQVVKDGNVEQAVRYVGDRREVSPLFVSHKHPCSRALEIGLREQYPPADGWSTIWFELREFLTHLTNNAKHAFADAPNREYLANTVVLPGERTS